MTNPVAEMEPTVARALATNNDYPREALLEAILLYLSEDLDRTGETAVSPPL